jgi:hypothetical protein
MSIPTPVLVTDDVDSLASETPRTGRTADAAVLDLAALLDPTATWYVVPAA